MTEEEKQLLLQDLCARLPYGIKLHQVSQPDTAFELYSIDTNSLNVMFWKYKGKSLKIGDCGKLIRYGELRYKPYLRPMESMTEEEVKELVKIHLIKYSPNSNYNNLLYIDRISKHGNNAWSTWIHYRTEYGDVKQTCVIVGWVNWETTLEEINWLYKNHFDVPHWIKSKNTYKTMIELDLALTAPKDMYNN